VSEQPARYVDGPSFGVSELTRLERAHSVQEWTALLARAVDAEAERDAAHRTIRVLEGRVRILKAELQRQERATALGRLGRWLQGRP